MNIVIDTCTLINIQKSGCLAYIRDIPSLSLMVGDLVYDELSKKDNSVLITLDGRIERIDIDVIPPDEFEHLITVENLGEGEAECIAIGQELGVLIATDDGKARNYVIDNLGRERLIGSIGLIGRCVLHELKTRAQAYRGYQRMVEAGAFLPHFCETDFLALVNCTTARAGASR